MCVSVYVVVSVLVTVYGHVCEREYEYCVSDCVCARQ